ncbi:Dna-directed rna polymerase subunit alpha [Thalictrum thalictroides]|uniref:Dna-directed rna polymerase subunit alpha n=1 Tax=Thalictrum thalictroides TaxID=46969 RepID=A0A7J6UV42_THATH|nr:Dna-directed rna polymerase subunit alpha [Thalictrum thalictroides]
MAKYIPPHKRYLQHTDSSSSSSPPPAAAAYDKGVSECHYITCARHWISKWLVVSSYDNDGHDQDATQLPFSIHLREYVCEAIEQLYQKKSKILLHNGHPQKGINEFEKAPWDSIVEKIHEDLFISFQSAKNEMHKDGSELKMPNFVFRLGKILFHGTPSIHLENVNKSAVVETALNRLKRTYYSNVPKLFVEAILGEFIQVIGLELEEETEYYHVKVYDKCRPRTTVICRCTVNHAVGELDLNEASLNTLHCIIELNKMRHLTADISCLDKSLDLRLMLSSKRTVISLNDEEKHSLNKLLKSAVIDSEVRGGLRWPPGKESVDDRFFVIGSCHVKDKNFKNSSIRLKIRQADQFDFRTSTSELTDEASVRMVQLDNCLRDESSEVAPMVDMVRETLRLIWDNLLCWEGSYT